MVRYPSFADEEMRFREVKGYLTYTQSHLMLLVEVVL